MIEILRQIDHEVFYFINQGLANPVLDFVCLGLRGKTFLGIWYLGLAAAIYRLYPQHFLKIAIAGAITFLLTDQLSAHVIKTLFHRLRPCNNPEIHARLVADHCGGGLSFVSAHAANSFGIATFVSLLRARWQATTIMLLWASLVSFSQVYVGVHFPADVVGGAMLGITIALISGSILRKFTANEVA